MRQPAILRGRSPIVLGFCVLWMVKALLVTLKNEWRPQDCPQNTEGVELASFGTSLPIFLLHLGVPAQEMLSPIMLAFRADLTLRARAKTTFESRLERGS